MKSKRWLPVAAFLACAVVSFAGTLDVPLYGQEMDNWCWDASSQMILKFYGFDVTQTAIANWAIGGQNKGNHMGPSEYGPLVVEGSSPQVTYMKRGCALVLTNFGPVNSTFLGSSLSMADVESEINSRRPAMLAVRWLQKQGTKLVDVGGHAIVLTGYESGNLVSLNDPWPVNSGVRYIVDYDDMFDTANTYYGSATLGNRWTQTLKTGRSLDLCFLIDSTGSMDDDIAQVKSEALNLISAVTNNYKDFRFAVVDYRDYPENPTGDWGDWITKVQTGFTRDVATTRNAINAISSGGGNDWPEAVFSAIIHTMSGAEIGAWRPDAERRIILMGDAPGHDPEPWSGGYSYGDLLAQWTSLTNKIAVHALYIGGDTSAGEQFTTLAGNTGGGTRFSDAAAGVPAAMADLIKEFTDNARYPQGETKAFKPIFTFTAPAESMLPAVSKVFLELQKYDFKKEAWKKYKKISLPATASAWQPKTALKTNDFRWRIGYMRKTGKWMLPSGESRKVKGASIMEPNWTEFTRVKIDPMEPTQLSPYRSFTATNRTVIYTFSSAVNADKYVMEIYKKNAKGIWKRWKVKNLKPPKKDPFATAFTVKIPSHKVGTAYQWRVQSLNYDRKKPVAGQWVGLPY